MQDSAIHQTNSPNSIGTRYAIMLYFILFLFIKLVFMAIEMLLIFFFFIYIYILSFF